MTKIIRLVLYTLIAIIVIAFVAFVGLVLFVNPNDFKPQISQAVYEKTGRTLTLGGDISWSFYPWATLAVANAELSNPKDFEQGNLAKIKQVKIGIKLLPLLHKKLVIDKLYLDGLNLNLTTDKTGRNNWQLTQPATESQQDTAPAQQASTAFAVQFSKLKVTDSNLTWLNQPFDQHIFVNNITLTSEKFGFNHYFPISLGFLVEGKKPLLHADIIATAKINLSPNYTRAQAKDLDIQVRPSANKGKNVLRIKAAQINYSNSSQLNLQTHLQITPFDLKAFLNQTLNFNLQTKNKGAMTQLSAEADLQYGPDLKLDNIQLVLDKSKLQGLIHLPQAADNPKLLQLQIDQFNLDDYLPEVKPKPTTPRTQTSRQQGNATEQPLFPVASLRELNLRGQFSIGSFVFSNLKSEKVTATLKANNGLIQLQPFNAALYKGSIAMGGSLNVRGETPSMHFNAQIADVNIEPIVAHYVKSSTLQTTGTGNIDLDITSQGNLKTQVLSNLNGRLRIAILNGQLKNLDLAKYVKIAQALLGSTAEPNHEQGGETTPFNHLTGSATISQGLLTTNDLHLESPVLDARGQGTVNLVTEQLDLLVQIKVTGLGQKEIAGIPLGQVIPLKISGDMAAPKIRLDEKNLLQQQAKNLLSRELKKLGVQSRGSDENDTAETPRKQLEDKLKGLLNF